MNGIAAALGCEPDEARALVGAMLERMPHRGVDRHLHLGPSLSLGRLGGALTQRGSRWIAADARLANRRELAERLGVEGDDATLILAAYERWGPDGAAHLEGDFAAVIGDESAGELVCLRDPFGLRPLHHALVGQRFLVASEPRALLAAPGLGESPDLEALAIHVVDDYPDDGRSLWHGVSAFSPGHVTRIAAGSFISTPFWSPDPVARRRDSPEALAEAFGEALDLAVSGRLDPEGSTGVLVSGGLDSTTVAAAARALGPARPTLLHATFPGLACDERPEAELAAKHLGLRLLTSDATALVASGPQPLPHPDLIYDPRWAIWPPLLAKAREDGIEVVLTGEGGDLVLCPTGVELADALTRLDMGAAWSFAASGSGGIARRVNRLARATARHLLPEMLLRARGSGSRSILAKPYAQRVEARRRERARRFEARGFPDATTRALFRGLELNACHPVSQMLDRTAAVAGVELSHPYLDRRVVELLLAVPHHLRHQPDSALDKPKPLLRRVAAKRLPPALAGRGASAEYSCYLIEVLNHHRPTIRELFETSRLVEAGVVDANALTDSELDRALEDDYTLLVQLSNAIGLELWLRQF